MKKTEKKLPEGKYYYSIGEVADYFEVTPATLRHWETMFETIAPRKNKKGDRMYNAQDVEAVRLVHFLVKESGYTLAGAVEHIRTNKKALTRRMEALRILRGVRSELEKLKNSL
ncbi:MAG TPA: MerR family transcriptional regulator [Candidatus Merdimorpha stercoravium]|uniref:MerR family transcriptional regulator n=1 Tax=Candidatus Merdimorpha stercoravium TaxID=2840863 RepID=A0A9D1H9X2_9FLAO|nr:MerR family transcriptional regulator [Candidatus Merdimorpha stercoravium]